MAILHVDETTSGGGPTEAWVLLLLQGLARLDAPPARNARLVEDLGLDSLTRFELLSSLEEALDEALPEKLFESFVCVDDVLELVRLRAGQRHDEAVGLDLPSREHSLDPPTEGRHVRLASVEPHHLPLLHRWMTDPASGYRWRFRGGVPSPDDFAAVLWANSLATFALESTETGELIGLCSASSADFRNGYAYGSAFLAPRYRNAGWPAEGVVLFTNYVFHHFQLRKLYIEALEFNVEQFGSALGTLLHVEGRLAQHEFYGDSFVDMIVMGLYRDEFMASNLRATVVGRS